MASEDLFLMNLNGTNEHSLNSLIGLCVHTNLKVDVETKLKKEKCIRASVIFFCLLIPKILICRETFSRAARRQTNE